jgi:DmsE family decaheme c-type cytochrome
MLGPLRTANEAHTPPPQNRGRLPRAPRPVLASAAVLFLAGLAARPQAQAPAQSGYAGSEICAACHDDIVKAFRKNPHQRAEARGPWQGRACESCHGPGAKHAESGAAADIENPDKLVASRAERVCLECHGSDPALRARAHGAHSRSQVSCVECHRIHGPVEELVLKTAGVVNRQCASCHRAEWAEFLRPHTHPLREGAMSCSDCHNPHGTPRPRSMQMVSANEPGCFRCHGDKRGPFPFEHPPVRLEGCQACHEPHGSRNPRMLVRAEVRFLCLECHSNIGSRPALGGIPPALHDLQSPRYRNCTICHSKIHGSFVSRGLTR